VYEDYDERTTITSKISVCTESVQTDSVHISTEGILLFKSNYNYSPI